MHSCPWPTCSRRIDDRFWGCIEHWNAIPGGLRTGLRKAEGTGDEADLIAAKAEIAKWIDENGSQADQQRAMQISVSSGSDIDFAAGITNDGRVFMLWPRRGEFSTLTKDESAIVLRAVRAMLAVAT